MKVTPEFSLQTDQKKHGLWQQIAAFEFPAPQPDAATESLTFADYVARELRVSPGNAGRLIEEYRRHIYLRAISAGDILIPAMIGAVAELHKKCDSNVRGPAPDFIRINLDRPNYPLSWSEFAGLHCRTQSLYGQEFGRMPGDIWPGPKRWQAGQWAIRLEANIWRLFAMTFCVWGAGFSFLSLSDFFGLSPMEPPGEQIALAVVSIMMTTHIVTWTCGMLTGICNAWSPLRPGQADTSQE